MAEKKDPVYLKISNIDFAPDIAQALGEIMVAWSYIESVLLGLLNCLTRTRYSQSAAIFYSIPTFAGRVTLIKNIIETHHSLTKPECEEILQAIEAVRGLSGTRNSYVHHAWAVTSDFSSVVLFDYTAEPNGPNRRKTVKSNDMRQHADAVIRRGHLLGKAIKQKFPEAPFDQPFPTRQDLPQKKLPKPRRRGQSSQR